MSPMREAQEGPARSSFRRKVEYLEWLSSEKATLEWYPKTVRELSNWENAERGFTRWVSFSVATLNGPNGDLRRRYDAVLALLKGSTSRKARGREVGHATALAQVKVLAGQNGELLEELGQLKRELSRRAQYIATLEDRERELIDTLNKLLPLERRLVSKIAQ